MSEYICNTCEIQIPNMRKHQVFNTKKAVICAPFDPASCINTCRHDSAVRFVPYVSSTSFSVAKGTAPTDTSSALTSIQTGTQLAQQKQTMSLSKQHLSHNTPNKIPLETADFAPSAATWRTGQHACDVFVSGLFPAFYYENTTSSTKLKKTTYCIAAGGVPSHMHR